MTKDEAITILKTMKNSTTYGIHTCDALGMGIKALEQPERKKSKWIEINNPNYSPFDLSPEKIAVCPVCGYNIGQYYFNYCPYCGADMREEKTDAEIH